MKKNNIDTTISRKKIFWFSFAASLLLLITTSAYWVNRQLFNAENFTNTVTESLTSESSREAIAQSITDNIYAERPIAKRFAGNFTTKVISGVLDSDQFDSVLTTAVEKLQVYATSKDQQTVVIELGGIKDIINQVTNIANNLGRETKIDTNNIPEEIVIVRAEEIPDLYKIGIVFMWIAPITLIVALLLLAYPYFKKAKKLNITLLIQGITITLVGIFGLIIGPLFKPPLLAQVNKQNPRVVISNLYDAFINTFNHQIAVMIYLGLIMILIATLWTIYPTAKKSFLKSKKLKSA